MSVEVTVNRAAPVQPPIESVTLTLDPEIAAMVKDLCGIGTVHLTALDGVLTHSDGRYSRIPPHEIHKVYHALKNAGI